MDKTANIVKAALPMLAMTTSGVQEAAAASPLRPNIVFILADDMGYECIGAYGSTYSTPNIDRLAEEGIMFTSAYSQPLSTPSRVEAMTGMYNHRNYCEFGFLNHDQKTFANMAKEAGYNTCIAGKWQLGANSGLPEHFGFDRWCLWQLNYARGNEAERYADPLIEMDGKLIDGGIDSYGPDIFESYIESFISEQEDGTPFFVYWPMALVHDPFTPTPDSDSWESNPEGRKLKDDSNFPDMVEYCDKLVGKLVSFLKEKGLYENTLIIFTGDNGTNRKIYTPMKDGSTIRGGKGLTTDAGTHVALITNFGNRQTGSGICDDLIDFTDFFPTFAQAMKYNGPLLEGIDGKSFLPQAEGRKGHPRDWVFCHYDSFFKGAGHPEKNARRYIRNHMYKLYSTGEFYDITEDIKETRPVIPGTENRQEARNRKALEKALSAFPAWKAGDIPVKKIEYPELKTDQKRYRKPEQ